MCLVDIDLNLVSICCGKIGYVVVDCLCWVVGVLIDDVVDFVVKVDGRYWCIGLVYCGLVS